MPVLEKVFQKSPFKKSFIIATLIIWNILFIPIILGLFKNNIDIEFRPNFYPPLIFAFIVSTLILLSKKIQNTILKKGKTFRDIKKFTILIFSISTLFLILQIIT